jgi:hypothetical protein
MTTQPEAAQQAALEQPEQEVKGCDHCNHPLYAAIKCRVCGRVTEQETVAWRWRMRNPTDSPGFAQPWNVTTYYPREQANEIEPLYTRPPRREWRGLTEEEIYSVMPYCDNEFDLAEFKDFARDIEAALKERNA